MRLELPTEKTVVSWSMFPVLPPGTKVLIRPLRKDEPKFGQIVLLDFDGVLAVHRFLGCIRGKVITKGDANLCFDGYEERSSVRPRIVGVVLPKRDGGYQESGYPRLVLGVFGLLHGSIHQVIDAALCRGNRKQHGGMIRRVCCWVFRSTNRAVLLSTSRGGWF